MQASVVVACRLSSCDAQAYLLHIVWDLPRPGLEPVSPALAGGFLTTAPPGSLKLMVFPQDNEGTGEGALIHTHILNAVF